MKKIYLLSLFCLACFGSLAQTTVNIWANGASGTYKTGNATAAARNDNSMVSTAATQRGYAVFDLTAIPAGSMINSCTIGFYVSTYGGSGTPSGWNTYGYAGDLSTVSTAATLFADMVAGTSLTTATYGTALGNQTLATTAAIVSFLQANIGSKVSICWTGGATRIYTMSGETGSTASITTAGHAPYLSINYCPPPTVVTATALPNPLCQGATLNLTGTGTGTGTLSFAWSGPGGFTSAMVSPSLTTGPASSGVYTLTVTNTCGTGAGTATALTPVVTVNPLPTITGGPDICTGSSYSLTGFPGSGTWATSDASKVSVVAGSGLLGGVSPGTVTITYTDPDGCVNTSSITDVAPPGPISGPATVCNGSSITLTDGVGGGTWSDDLTGTVSTVPGTGVVTGNAAGLATIYYATSSCAAVSYTVSVVPIPAAITGATDVCVGATISLSGGDPGATWSSSDITLATVAPTGDVLGIAPGSLNILNTDPISLCSSVLTITVDALPAAIGGVSSVCVNGSITLTETTPGGTWSGGGAFANVIAGTGVVNGITAGVTNVTYTVTSTNCLISTPITVNPNPAAITAGTGIVCANATIPYADVNPGGTWTSTNTGVATVGTSSGVVTGVAAGVTSIVYTLSTGCTANAPVTVNAAPVSTITAAGPTTFCAGGSVVLNGTVGAGLTYQWNKNGVIIPGATGISYTATSTGAITLSITNSQSCVTISAVENIVDGIVATLTTADPRTFCIGGHATFGVNTGGVTGSILYQWKKNGVAILAATNSTYSATTSGTYKCDVNVTGGSGTCSVESDSDVVTVNTLPNPSISWAGVLLSTATGYSSYQWYLNTVAIPGAVSSTLNPPSNGTFKVMVSDGNGCSNFSPPLLITNVGVNELNTVSGISIAPNPVTSVFHIDAPCSVKAVITGMEGKILLQQTDAMDINISDFSGGVYLISLYDQKGNKVYTGKIVKE